MHRPGIVKIVGDKIILNGTTMREIEDYHLDTLELVIDKVNEISLAQEIRQQEKAEELARQQQEHTAAVTNISQRIKARLKTAAALPTLSLRMFRQDDRSHLYQESLSFVLSGQSNSYTKVFGLVLENGTQLSVAKHINIRILISWGGGEQLIKAPVFEVPPNTKGWKAEPNLLINEYPAVFKFKDANLASIYGHPEEWNGFKFTVYEKWNGFFRLNYSISSVEPFTENTGELSIRIS